MILIFFYVVEMGLHIEPLVTGDPLSVRMTLMTSKHQTIQKINKSINNK